MPFRFEKIISGVAGVGLPVQVPLMQRRLASRGLWVIGRGGVAKKS